MQKLEIKFSHDYPKLYGQSKATLLAVRELKFPEDKNMALINYDTLYFDFGVQKYFPLDDGEYVQLIFVGDKHIPFCTIRKKWCGCGNKKECFERHIGKEFEIVILSDLCEK